MLGKRSESHLGRFSLELAAVSDDAGLVGAAGLGAALLESLDDVHALDDLAKDAVLAIEPWAWDSGDEELAAVRVRTSVGHGEHARNGVLLLEVLISELGAVDGLTTSAVASGEVTTLDHEVWDDTMELAALVVKWLAGLADALLASAKAAEVLGSLRDDIREELENDPASGLATDGDVEEDPRTAHS